MQPAASIDLGPYQLLERIGEGGSGQVYRAVGPSGTVAVKLLGSASDLDEAAGARFRREIGALRELSHPHLVRLLDHGEDPELGPYLVLPLLAGTNLRVVCGGRAMCPEAALLLAQPIAHAVAALHAAGFVHRDLKPENVIASPDGSITVIDLGLAWRDDMTRHTETGTAVGSVGYMAPEQIEGRPVDERADVWALGVMIYEWIAGKRPFARARPAEEAAAMLVGAYPALTAADRRCDDELAELVRRCLEADPARRPTAVELAREIDARIDWAGALEPERAAVVADPIGYQARVAPFRVRRVAHLAREALADGKPFVALAWCDRGLAYVPEDPALLELVAAAETATRPAREASSPPTSPPMASPMTSPVSAGEQSRAPVRARWSMVAVGLGALIAGALVAYLAVPERSPPATDVPGASAPAPASASSIGTLDDRDRELLGSFVTLFGQALEMSGASPSPTPGPRPTTARGWLALAGTQPPAEAVKSIREALALSPGWIEAQIALCVALAGSEDPGALAACDVAVQRQPNAAEALGARGRAKLDTGDLRGALVDLDRAVAADPDPRWRRLRARARSRSGDHAGARSDLAHACELGDADACATSP